MTSVILLNSVQLNFLTEKSDLYCKKFASMNSILCSKQFLQDRGVQFYGFLSELSCASACLCLLVTQPHFTKTFTLRRVHVGFHSHIRPKAQRNVNETSSCLCRSQKQALIDMVGVACCSNQVANTNQQMTLECLAESKNPFDASSLAPR